MGWGALVVLVQVATVATGPTAVTGVVRAAATGHPIADARLELPDGSAPATTTDARGAFVIRAVPAGRHRLRVSADGFVPLRVDVLLVGDAPLQLDVALASASGRVAERLATVRVLARPADAAAGARRPGAESGVWRVSGPELRASPATEDGDPFVQLAASPQAQMLGETAAAVHVRGGSSDQNLYLLDGAPVYSPVHPGRTPSAFSPDIVDELTVHGAAPEARYGGRLSSVVEVRTPSPMAAREEVRGGFDATAVRTALTLPLVAGRAGLSVSARHSYSGLRHEERAESSMPGTWSDAFGRFTVRLAGDDITLSSFQSDNALGFPASGNPEAGEGAWRPYGRNGFAWESSTRAVFWRHPVDASTNVETRAWSARSSGEADWSPDSDGVTMRSALHDAGLSVLLSHAHGGDRRGGRLTAGLDARRLATRYAIAGTGTETPASSALLHVAAAPVVGALFVQDEWRPAESWTIGAGLRGSVGTGSGVRAEPRLSAAFHPSARFGIAAGYARMHQYVQSLRNEESVLGTLVAPDLLVAANGARVPVASSDELTTSADVALDPRTQLGVVGYARRLRGLVLVAPVSSEPFARDAFVVGRGAAWGGGATVARRWDRISARAGYGLAVVTRSTGEERYHPGFAASQSASLAVGDQLTARTLLRSVVAVTSGRPTTPLGDDVGWDTRDSFSAAPEVSGTPAHTVGPLDGDRLPVYLRVDVGVRHALPLRRARGLLEGYASLDNALARENAAGYVVSAAATRRDLVMLPLSLLLGMTWRY